MTSGHNPVYTQQPVGPTDHLDTVEYWKQLYLTAVEVGQEKVDAIHSALKLLKGVDGCAAARRILNDALLRPESDEP
jgi:hypothetical protein